jgi:hypothetical protein
VSVLPSWISTEFPEVLIMNITNSSWQLPNDIKPPEKWKYYPDFSLDYHLQGRWRLTFMPQFVRSMGYKYWLQIDDDTFVTEIIPFNIVDIFREQNKLLGVRGRYYKEYPNAVKGLAEFTR